MTYPMTKWNASIGTECGIFYHAGGKLNAKHIALRPVLDEHSITQGAMIIRSYCLTTRESALADTDERRV